MGPRNSLNTSLVPTFVGATELRKTGERISALSSLVPPSGGEGAKRRSGLCRKREIQLLWVPLRQASPTHVGTFTPCAASGEAGPGIRSGVEYSAFGKVIVPPASRAYTWRISFIVLRLEDALSALKKLKPGVKHASSRRRARGASFLAKVRVTRAREPVCVAPMAGTKVRVFTLETFPESFKNDVAETLERLKRLEAVQGADSRDY